MGTVAGPEEKTVGVVQQLGNTIRLTDDRVSGVVYGHSGGSLWPLSLVVVAGIGLALDIFIVGFIALILLAIWIGGKR